MNIFTNPRLTEALTKLTYPLDDYREFAASWPNTASEIMQLHEQVHIMLSQIKMVAMCSAFGNNQASKDG